jgi:hypothetical protein
MAAGHPHIGSAFREYELSRQAARMQAFKGDLSMRKKYALYLLVTAVLAGALPACQALSQKEEIRYVDSTLWTKAYDIKVVGERAYCAFLNGLMILDLSDKRRPALISELYLGGGNGIAVEGSFAYVAAGKHGMCVADISDENAPRMSGSFDTPGDARDVAVSEDYAFVADASEGLQVLKINRPEAPVLSAALDTPGSAEDIVLAGSYAYVADGDAGLQIIDIRDPAAPQLVGGYDTPDKAERVAVSGEYAYVADGSSGLQILNIRKPEAPELVTSFTTAGYAHSIKVRGNYAYIGNLYDGGFQIVDISDPKAPFQAGWRKYTMYNESWEVAVEEGFAYVVDYFAGVYVITVQDPAKPSSLGYYYTPGSILAAEALGERICALGDLSGFNVIDGTVPGALKVIGSTPPFRGVHGMTAAGQLGLATDRWGLRIFDFSELKSIKQVGRLDIPGVARAVVVRGNLAYLTADLTGFHMISLKDPTLPELLGSFEMTGFAYDLDVKDDRAYIANSDTGFHILDTRDPASISQIGFLETPGLATGVSVEGIYAYVADGDAGLQVIDVSDPAAPKIVGTCAVDGFANSVKVNGMYAYVSDESFGLLKIDVSNPQAPKVVASFETPGESASVNVWGEYILIADSFSLIVVK